MANPNIVNVTTIYGKLLTGTSISLGLPSAGTVYKINAIYASNDTTSAAEADATINGTPLVKVSVPAKSTLDVLSKSVYLTEDQTSGLVCNTVTGLDYVVSYEEISDQ